MKEDELKFLASQLRKPTGEYSSKIAHIMNEGNRLMNEAAIKGLKLQANDNILEIGMGNGYFVGSMVQQGEDIKYTGLDFSPEMIAQATAINQQMVNSGKVKFIEGNISSLPFEDNTFTKLMTVNTIYFWENPRQVLEEIKRVVMPAGKIVIGIRPERTIVNFPFTKFGFTTYSKEKLQDLLEGASMEASFYEYEEPEKDVFGKKVKVEYLIAIVENNKKSI